ncbi:hypothetical protein IEQ34_019702 [Dendrobium chrysotoxum]|uniref:EF-hand domain-containing protein n=1 Tax=Dendrobium chrysotoxum TaxID=161865 RepID=A0AAV7GAP0_DENCH|nr:hypothetical protein IEQ34_019702 [Dendrobium chrysotoxum]
MEGFSSTKQRSCMNVMGDELSQEEAKGLIKSMDVDGDGLLTLQKNLIFLTNFSMDSIPTK